MDKRALWTIIICFVLVSFISLVGIGLSNRNRIVVEAPQETEIEESVQEVLYDYEFKSATAYPEKTFTVETDLFKVIFDTKGASVKSMMLKEHSNADGQPVDILFKGENDPNAFLLYWEDDINKPILDNFDYSIQGKKVIFTNTYRDSKGKEVKINKTFEFKDGEYLFALDVDVDGNTNNNGYTYTIGYQPQVGPDFTKMQNNNYDYRRFYVGLEKNNGKVKRSSVKLTNNYFVSTRSFDWMSLTSKYFTVIARPENLDNLYKYQALQSADGDIAQSNGFFISVPNYAAENRTRVYFYCGPQLKKTMGSYYSGTDNAWGLRNYNLDDAMESGSILGWLEVILKWCLQILQKVVKNYGIAIILLTIILKFAMWPLQKKSSESNARIAALGPQMDAIKAKYPDNPQKQNAEMSKLYKEYGANPLSGCLPLLLQFPILIAFYGLLNRHIELRGAMFIPGWIPDLSLPDMIAVLKFRIPLLGNEIHLLPIIYTASMIYSMKYTQASNPSAKDPSQKGTMFFMTWGMPIMFFFILYNAPSGLLLYWTTQNALSVIQQVVTNKKMASGKLTFEKKEPKKVEPEAVRKYEEKMKKLQEMKEAMEKAKKNK